MPKVVFYFQVHQPSRLKKYPFFNIGKDDNYFNESTETDRNNKKVFQKVAEKCYLPTAALLLGLLKKHPELRLSFSFSGIFLDQAQSFYPEVLEAFKKLTDTGQVEVLSETYYHSLSFLHSMPEFRRQIQKHRKKINEVFNQDPKVFRNTELILNNDLAYEIASLGYTGILAEGADHILGWRSPNFVYRPKGVKGAKLLLKNYQLSDDIAFRFSSRDWAEFPLTAPKFASWISAVNGNGEVVNLFMDFETFGEHQWADTGIFEFLKHLPAEILKHPDNGFMTPSEALAAFSPVSELDMPHFVSWADTERDLSAWQSNPMQQDALEKLFALEAVILDLDDEKMIEDWRRLTTSDHFYYMCTKWFNDGDVHKYFNPYDSPYEAFTNFMNVLADLRLRAENKLTARQIKKNEVCKELERMTPHHA